MHCDEALAGPMRESSTTEAMGHLPCVTTPNLVRVLRRITATIHSPGSWGPLLAAPASDAPSSSRRRTTPR